MSGALAAVQNTWAAYSFVASVGGLSGLALIALAFTLTAWLPRGVRRALLAGGALIVSHSLVLQLGTSHGASQATQLASKRASEAEAQRVELARPIDQRQAQALAAEQASNRALSKKLKDLQNALSRSADADRECLSGADARRLRDF